MEQACVNMFQKEIVVIFIEIDVTERNTEFLSKNVLDTENDHKQGYFLECDLQYPPKRQRNSNNLQFYLEKKIKKSNFSDCMVEKKSLKQKSD